MDLKDYIRTIKDFPEEGILFRDITPLLKGPEGFSLAIDEMCNIIKDIEYDYIASPESRGFIFGMPVAYKLRKAFIPIRKAGKLPCETYKKNYDLEYGHAAIEIHKDAIEKGGKVVVVDDLLATGGTSSAICDLIEEAGGKVCAHVFLIELGALGGRELLLKHDKNVNVHSILKY